MHAHFMHVYIPVYTTQYAYAFAYTESTLELMNSNNI